MDRLSLIVVEFRGTELPEGRKNLPEDDVAHDFFLEQRPRHRLARLRADKLFEDLHTAGWYLSSCHSGLAPSVRYFTHQLVRYRLRRGVAPTDAYIDPVLLRQLAGKTYQFVEIHQGHNFAAIVFKVVMDRTNLRLLRFKTEGTGFTLETDVLAV